jgi:hypothetical protein
MTFEIFGFSIGEIVAIGALIASTLIFWFGYSRTRKSEQIKIAREVMDNIERRRLTVIDLFNTISTLIDENKDIDEEIIKKIRLAVAEILEDIEYFTYLIENHEIEDKLVVKYYHPKIRRTLDWLIRASKTLDNRSSLRPKPSHIELSVDVPFAMKKINEDCSYALEYWESLQSSRIKKIFNKFTK